MIRLAEENPLDFISMNSFSDNVTSFILQTMTYAAKIWHNTHKKKPFELLQFLKLYRLSYITIISNNVTYLGLTIDAFLQYLHR